MRKTITFMAVLALVACDSATGSDREARAGRAAEAQAPAGATGASLSGGASHRAVIASARARVVGTPSLYTARALAVDGGEVTLEVRSSTIGFNNLTSGTLVASDTWTGETNQDFQATAGTRYLIIAYPSANGVVDAAHAHFFEVRP